MPCQQQRGKSIRETGANFNNDAAASSEVAETNAYSVKKVPSTDDENNLSNFLEQFRVLDEKCADLENKVSDLEGKNRSSNLNAFSLNRFTSDEAMLYSIQASLNIKRSWQPCYI